MKKLFTAVALLFSLNSFAELDYSTEYLVRSFPIGLFAKANIGKSFKLWGDPKGPKKVLYGFVRPSANFRTSVIVNNITGRIDFYPISILSVFASYQKGRRDAKFIDTFDCDVIACKGDITRKTIGTRFALAYQNVFLTSDHKWIDIHLTDKETDFADEMTTLVARGSRDDAYVGTTILGYKFNDEWKAGIANIHNKMDRNKSDSYMRLGLVSHTRGSWDYMVAAGNFHTRFDQNVLTVLTLIKWTGKKGLLLF